MVVHQLIHGQWLKEVGWSSLTSDLTLQQEIWTPNRLSVYLVVFESIGKSLKKKHYSICRPMICRVQHLGLWSKHLWMHIGGWSTSFGCCKLPLTACKDMRPRGALQPIANIPSITVATIAMVIHTLLVLPVPMVVDSSFKMLEGLAPSIVARIMVLVSLLSRATPFGPSISCQLCLGSHSCSIASCQLTIDRRGKSQVAGVQKNPVGVEQMFALDTSFLLFQR